MSWMRRGRPLAASMAKTAMLSSPPALMRRPSASRVLFVRLLT
jgi:hypothetical protein